MDKKNLLDKSIDAIFSIRKEGMIILVIFLLALILRIVAAINLSISADDMHHVTHAINFFSAGRLEVYDQSAGLWHAFTSIIYGILGTTQIASRTASIIFGSLSIILIYLLSKEFFNEKVSLFAALLLALSPFHIRITIAEMDVMAMFFVLLSMLLFVRGMKTNKNGLFAISGITLGLAIYTKVYPLLFIPSLLLYAVYTLKKNKERIFTNEKIKQLIVFLVCIFIFAVPALTHNYLLYKDKGFLDLQFTRTLDLGKDISERYYGWDVQFNAENDWKGLIFGNSVNSPVKSPMLFTTINFIRLGDPVTFYLGILGILIVLFFKKEHKNYLIFFVLGILFILPFLSSIIILSKHYIFLNILIIPLASLSIDTIIQKIENRTKKKTGKVIASILILISLVLLGIPSPTDTTHFYGKSAIAQLMDFKDSKISSDSLIVTDSRIYRGQINWALQGKPYIEASDFLSFLEKQGQIGGKEKSINVYFVECVTDDCGWGTIRNQPELNKSMESLVSFFSSAKGPITEISAPTDEKSYYPLLNENKQKIFRIYSTNMKLKEVILPLASQPKQWFLYDIGYEPKEKQFDYYTTDSNLDKLLDKIAHLIVLIALILAFIAPFYSIYLIVKS